MSEEEHVPAKVVLGGTDTRGHTVEYVLQVKVSDSAVNCTRRNSPVGHEEVHMGQVAKTGGEGGGGGWIALRIMKNMAATKTNRSNPKPLME